MAGSANLQKAGAAYEAVMVDKVSPVAQQLVDSINKIRDAFNGLNAPAKQVAQSMTAVSGAIQTIQRENRRTVDSMRTLQQTIIHVQMAASAMGQAVGQAMMHLGRQVQRAGLAAMTAAAVMGGGFIYAGKTVASYEEQVNRLRALFGDTADENLRWAEQFSERIGRPITETITGLSTLRGTLAQLDNLPAAKLDEMARNLHSMAIDLASVSEIPDAEALERIQAAISGEPEALRSKGINVMDAAVKDYAESLGIASKELNYQQKLMLRYVMIAEQMEKNLNAIGDALRTKNSLTNQFKRLRAELMNLSLVVGQHLEPTFTRIIGTLRELSNVVRQLGTGAVDQLVGAFTALGVAGAGLYAFGTVMTMIGPAIIAIGTTVSAVMSVAAALIPLAVAFPTLAAALVTVGSGFAALAGVMTYFVIKAFPVAQTIERLRDAAQELGRVFRLAVEAMYGAIQAKNWDDVWLAFELTSEIVFRRLGVLLYEVIRDALWQAGVAYKEWIDRRVNDIKYYAWGAVTGEWMDDAEGDQNIGWLDWQRKQIDELMDRLERLALKYREARKEAEKDPKKKLGKLAEDMGPEDTPGLQQAFRDMNMWESVGSYAANFARDVGRFAPSIDPMRELQRIAEEQNRKQQKNLEANEETNRILKAMDSLVF